MNLTYLTVDQVSGTAKYAIKLLGREVELRPMKIGEQKQFTRLHDRFTNETISTSEYMDLMAEVTVPILNKRILTGDPFAVEDLDELDGLPVLARLVRVLIDPEGAAQESEVPN